MEKAKANKKTLILHIPVIHKGYLQLLKKLKPQLKEIYLIEDKLLKNLTKHEPNIASIKAKEARKLLESLGLKNIKMLSTQNIKDIENAALILIQGEIAENLQNKFLKSADINWESAFLRWDRQKVLSYKDVNVAVSTNKTDLKLIQEAYKEALKSGDWWRQVGAILTKKGKILLRAYNKGMPDDTTPYQTGDIRDYLEVGERPDLASTVHAEQLIIAEAAKKGISTEGTTLYITHFPCAVCAKLIANAGITKCMFCEGSSNAAGQKVLESAGVKITRVIVKNQKES